MLSGETGRCRSRSYGLIADGAREDGALPGPVERTGPTRSGSGLSAAPTALTALAVLTALTALAAPAALAAHDLEFGTRFRDPLSRLLRLPLEGGDRCMEEQILTVVGRGEAKAAYLIEFQDSVRRQTHAPSPRCPAMRHVPCTGALCTGGEFPYSDSDSNSVFTGQAPLSEAARIVVP